MGRTRIAAGLLLSAIALGTCPGLAAAGDTAELKLENLLQTALAAEFTPDREIVISIVEIPPHTTLERHWHPGEEFHYYLEGEAEVVIDGQPTIIAKPGMVGHIPYKAMHTAITHEQGAKALVFRVHAKGEPVRYLESGGTAER